MSFRTSRRIAAPPSSVFAALEDDARLAVWWGPAGFTSTFDCFEFLPGGRWSFVMHAPDGRDYPNEIVIREIDSPARIVIDHVSKPRYRLTVTFDPLDGGETVVGWDQEFEDPETGRAMERIVVPANEQLLDRLAAEVLRGTVRG